MYDLGFDDAGFCIINDGEPIVSGIVPSVVLDDGIPIGLVQLSRSEEDCHGSGPTCRVHRMAYQDASGSVAVSLTLTVTNDTLVAEADVKALKGGIGVRAKGLASYGGLRLAFTGLGEVDGLMANYLHKDWWTRPHFKTDPKTLPPRTQSVVWRTGRRYHHLMCICDDVMKTELEGSGSGAVIVTSAYAPGYMNVQTVLFALSSGDEPSALPDRNVAAGMAALGTPYQTRERKRYPQQFEYLGWCSWDAFYHEVSAEGILAKAGELAEKGVPVRWFIVDDGWMHHDERRLLSLEPDEVKFPDGFAPLVTALKASQDISWVGVWHTLTGYWGGIQPGSPLAVSMGDALVTTHNGRVVPSPDAAKAFRFWNAWHMELRNDGVDFVKVDYQSGLVTFWQQELGIGAAASAAHEALEASVGKNFDNAMINCMGMAVENLWHRPTSSVTRSSDDFFPKEEASFVEHSLQNAYNAYYHAPFMWLDWDMWWTQHEHAATHAVLRAVSGGPVYVSDRVGQTDPERLWPLILSDGRLLRCDRPGVATADCLLLDPSQETVPLKIWNRVGDAGVVAAINVHAAGETVSGSVSPADVPGLEGDTFVVYEHFTRKAEVVAHDTALPVVLPAKGCGFYVIVPLGIVITPIGLVDKYIGPAAIADWFVIEEKTTIVLLDGGVFAWAAGSTPADVRVNGVSVGWDAGDGVFTVDCSEYQGSVWVEITHG